MSGATMTPLRELGEWSGGNTPSKANAAYWDNGTVPWVSPKDMKVDEIASSEDRITDLALADGRVSMVPAGSVLFVTRSGILAHTFPVAVTKLPVTINQDLKALSPKPGVSPKYVAHAVRGASQRLLKECSKHGTTVASVDTKALLDFEIPMVAVERQRAIVAEIEKQFSRLDEAVANLQRVKANLVRYRAATLNAAMSGTVLTDLPGVKLIPDVSAAAVLREVVKQRPLRWRGKYESPAEPTPIADCELPSGWVWATISQLMAERIVNGLSVKEAPEETEVRALRLNAMTNQGFDYSEFRHLPIAPSEVDDIVIGEGEFFVSRGNGSLELVGRGTVAQAPPASFIFPDTMMRIRFTTVAQIAPWVAMLWPSRFIRKQIEARVKTTAGIYKIAQPQLASITVPFPPVVEQHRIVAEVDRRLSIVREVEAEVDANLKRAQALRQAILGKAFNRVGGA